jgi:spermidine/putrescine transport system permease protein
MAILRETARPAPAVPATPAPRSDTPRRWLLCAPALVVLVFAASGPLLIVLIYSFLAPGDFGGIEWRLSTEGWFRVFFARDIFEPDIVRLNEAHAAIFWRSIRLALQTTLICALLGFPTAWFIATRPQRTRVVWLFLITIPFWTNLLIRTFAIQEVIRNEGLVNTVLIAAGVISSPIQMLYTDFAILVGMAYVFLPLMVLPLYAAMEKMDMRLLEAAYDLYASRARVLWHVVLPLVKPGFIAGSILVFIPSIGAYVTPRVLGGGRNLMLGNLIELQFGQGRNWPLGSALALTLLVMVVAALVFYIRVTSRDEGTRHV